MTMTLEEVAQAYLADYEFQAMREYVARRRDASIPKLQAVTHSFMRREIGLQDFRSQLEKTLRADEDWGANSFGFMMELNKFGKYHAENYPQAEERLRNILDGMTAANLGVRIEAFYQFLLSERERLRHAGRSSKTIVAARNSAFIISLFAFWLDPTAETIIYYDSLRKGLYLLIRANLLPTPPERQLGSNSVEVSSASDHRTCLALIDDIAQRVPQIKRNIYWAEAFCLWVTQHLKSLTDPATTLIIDTDDAALLAASATRRNTVNEQAEDYALTPAPLSTPPESQANPSPLIAHEPLMPTPEPLLSRLIREVQRQILIDESVVRRIYHALLAGHVILTGPPGTGKTDLARLIPEILWRSEPPDAATPDALTTRTAYATRLVTATDEWSVRTLISGLAPQTQNGAVSYTMQYGFLTTSILKNWAFQGNSPEEWSAVTLQRTTITTASAAEPGLQQTFRGQWLVIDEFNRAPIDRALGDALTALGGSEVLRVSIEGGSAELPIPFDFRIIGTLNSFDRNYLNEISEALKRRFSFIEILPPSRAMSAAEQGMVFYKALKKVSHLSTAISIEENGLYWQGVALIGFDPDDLYTIVWDEGQPAFREAFEAAWHLFEVVRIYRQLGTAQAISLLRHMLIAGLLQGYTTPEAWIEQALDAALCDTLADQLQILLPDEIETLLLYLTTEHINFVEAYNALLADLASTPQRLYRHLLSLSSVSRDNGQPFLSDEKLEQIAAQDQPEVPSGIVTALFHLEHARPRLSQFTRRLRAFKSERGL